MRKTILKELQEFEKNNGVDIILAVESGSRGWGFASADADYDVRFVYVYPTARYLSIKSPQDCFNWFAEDRDYEGFDIHKFYGLLYKSNMNIIDWVVQDEAYINKMEQKAELKAAIKKGFDRHAYIAHNYGLCKRNFFKYFVGPSKNEPTAKRYVYCLRALFSAKYCREHNGLAPIKFDDLIHAVLSDEDISEINEILDAKKSTKEKAAYSNPKWEEYIKRAMESKGGNMEKQPHEECGEYYSFLNGHMLRQISALEERKS